MPYRRLPTNDTQLAIALDTAWTKWKNTAPDDRLITPAQAAKLEDAPTPLPPGAVLSTRAQFRKDLADVGSALSHQTDLTEDFEHAAAALAQICSHFIQVFNFAVQRPGGFARSDRAYYGLDVSGSILPPLAAYPEIESWGQKIVDGEAKRLAEQPGAKPMAMPAASEVAAALATFRTLQSQQSTAKDRYTTELDQVDALRPGASKLVTSLWNTIEFNLSELGLDGPTLRRRAREWGVTYLTRPDETPDPEPEPEPIPAPASPAPPNPAG